MGQKVNPIGYRLGVNKTWQSKWYSKDNYQEYLINDIKIREYLEKNLKEAAIASVIIERRKNKCEVSIYTAKPGVIIGRGGEDIEKLRKKLSKLVTRSNACCFIIFLLGKHIFQFFFNLSVVCLFFKIKIYQYGNLSFWEVLDCHTLWIKI